MTVPNTSALFYVPAQIRYWPSEVAHLLLNAVLAGEHGEAHALVADLSPDEAVRLLPCLLATAAGAMALLDAAGLEAWRSQARSALAGLPRAPADP